MPAEHTPGSSAAPQPDPAQGLPVPTPAGQRARDLLPEVLLTVLGIIQALALELAWSRLEGGTHLWAGGIDAWIGWLQMTGVLQGILLVWILYASLVLRLRWVPQVRDALLPFAIGIGEFVVVELSVPARLAGWLAALAGVFAISTATSVATFRTAARDPANRAFFAGLGAQLGRTLVPSTAFIAMLLLLAGVVWRTEPASTVGLAAVVAANLALGGQLALLASYWRASLGPRPEPDRAVPPPPPGGASGDAEAGAGSGGAGGGD